jgi:hypothetical protein
MLYQGGFLFQGTGHFGSIIDDIFMQHYKKIVFVSHLFFLQRMVHLLFLSCSTKENKYHTLTFISVCYQWFLFRSLVYSIIAILLSMSRFWSTEW